MKKILAFVLLLVFCFSMAACTGSENATTSDEYTKIGTSQFSIILPEGYAMAEDDFDEDQIAYYFKDDESIDFDVYQWDKDGKYTLKEEAEFYAGEYEAVVEEVEINGIKVMKYVSSEIFDESEYTVVNYMFEDEKSIIELCFWTVDTEEEYKAVEEIINTIKKN